MNKKICAIIVSYNIGREIYKCFNSVINQVDRVVMVDNGSNEETVAVLEKINKENSKVELIKNSVNLGLAAALNQGVKYALDNGFKWVLTLDHDSELETNMIEKIFSAYDVLAHHEQEKIGILAPNYIILKGPVYKNNQPFFLPTTITSGQIVKSETYKKIGLYKENLFIECIDHDFCLRALKSGLKTIVIPNTFLKQKIGNPEIRSLFGKKIVVINALPKRYYYIFRNSMYLYKNYLFIEPKWIFKNIISNLFVIAKIILFEKQKYQKFSAISGGIIKGLTNRF